MAGGVQVLGLDKLLHKLDPENTLKLPLAQLYREGGQMAEGFLRGTIPSRTGHSASSLALNVTSASARVSLAAYPLRFVEYGTHNPGHRKAQDAAHIKRARAFRYAKGDNVHIAPRRFMSKARTKTRANLRQMILAMKARVEQRWSAA